MFEILDKLLISFGQDTLDSLYWSAKSNMRKRCVFLNASIAAACYMLSWMVKVNGTHVIMPIIIIFGTTGICW